MQTPPYGKGTTSLMTTASTYRPDWGTGTSGTFEVHSTNIDEFALASSEMEISPANTLFSYKYSLQAHKQQNTVHLYIR